MNFQRIVSGRKNHAPTQDGIDNLYGDHIQGSRRLPLAEKLGAVPSLSTNTASHSVAGSERMTQRVETSAASFLEEVREARRMSPEEKLLAGARLFDYAVAITLAGIRNANPGADDNEVMRILEKRLDLAERFDSIPFSLERSGLDDER